ncbi:UBP-type zinc finger domain-containing protein [Gracilimonas sp.]|uniref:UBP-type zinc finger domain-containing protein n=1 Tax=Gracilimonas sp. TaxID=1974203 RepID=UPI0032EBF8B5
MVCGYVGCCNSSKNKHSFKHHHRSKHPLVKSLKFNENWMYCYIDNIYLDI